MPQPRQTIASTTLMKPVAALITWILTLSPREPGTWSVPSLYTSVPLGPLEFVVFRGSATVVFPLLASVVFRGSVNVSSL